METRGLVLLDFRQTLVHGLQAIRVDVNVLFLTARKRVGIGAGSLQLLDDLVLGFLVSSGLVLVDEP